MEKSAPALMAIQLLPVPTRVGADTGLPDIPSCPLLLSPQAHNDPSARIPSACRAPAATTFQSPALPTMTGVRLAVVDVVGAPRPSCPAVLRPQEYRLPSTVMACVMRAPAATETT